MLKKGDAGSMGNHWGITTHIIVYVQSIHATGNSYAQRYLVILRTVLMPPEAPMLLYADNAELMSATPCKDPENS